MLSENKCIYQSDDCIREWAKGCSGKPDPEDFIRSIESILKKDYKRVSFTDFKDKKAWDADQYEVALKKGTDRAETVDFVVGMANGQLLMVEAKLDVVNVENIKREIENKIQHTRTYLVSSTNYKSCASPSVVIFGNKKNNIQRNINKFMRLRSNKKDIRPMSLSDFYQRYFIGEEKYR